ncbi:beta-N-acetylhexosaminidase [Microbacterium sp. Leaf151]|uniref:beta-N-acetylhexosaminidase n=1 Tax=Microbacterium sp. Leaf151 TaxID=1736276 RepID=UPI0006FC54A4|nr:glycoside hydrolase family 20 protein [Microbacterium sp. Leaf151]KQR26399.1 hypothetical protein ASF76_03975 [Microbacterium sp. Leaf151]
MLRTLVAVLVTSLIAVGATAAPAAAATVYTDVDESQTSGENRFTYSGSWANDSGLPTDRWFDGTEHYANGTAGQSVTLSFVGTGAKLYGAKHPAHGIYAFSVDGGPETTFDGYAATVAHQQLLADTGALAAGPHTLTMRLTGTKNPASTGTAGQVDFATVSSEDSSVAPIWSALPQPSSLTLDGGSWKVSADSRILLLSEQRTALEAEAKRLSSELATSGSTAAALPIVVGTRAQIRANDIVLTTGDVPSRTSAEAYSITVGSAVEVTGESAAGVFAGTRQIVQNLKATSSVPTGSVISAPAVPERSLHIDVGRKQYSKTWIEQQLRDMSYVGLNTLQLHFSENEGFGIVSDSYPTIASPNALTKAQVREILSLAADQHIAVVPSLDMPGHLQAVLAKYPQYQLKDANGTAVRGALDITNPAAVAFAKTLIDEYAALFAGSTHWNLGADEFVDFEHMERYPVLQNAAAARYGAGATGFDLLTGFANDMNSYIRSKGFTTRVWNDGMFRSTHVTLEKDIEITWWTNWSPQMALLRTALDAGHNVVNFNDSVFYYVLGENAGYTYPTAAKIWNRDWKPGVFPTYQGGTQVLTAPYTPQLLGASFAIWSDTPAAQTETQVADGIRGPLRAMAERSWNDGSALALRSFTSISSVIGRAPGVEGPLVASGTVTELGASTITINPVVTSRCIAGKAVLNTTVANTTSGALALRIVSPYGTKTFATTAAGKNAFHVFTTRQKTMPAGQVVVTATGAGGATTTTTTPYTARTC